MTGTLSGDRDQAQASRCSPCPNPSGSETVPTETQGCTLIWGRRESTLQQSLVLGASAVTTLGPFCKGQGALPSFHSAPGPTGHMTGPPILRPAGPRDPPCHPPPLISMLVTGTQAESPRESPVRALPRGGPSPAARPMWTPHRGAQSSQGTVPEAKSLLGAVQAWASVPQPPSMKWATTPTL